MRTYPAIALALCFGLASCADVPPIEIPLHVAGGATEVPFSVASVGRYDIEIAYPRGAAHDVTKELHALRGSATIIAGSTIIKHVELPTDWTRYQDNSFSTVIARIAAEPKTRYRVSLHLTHIPLPLRSARATLKIGLVGPKSGGPANP